ncbi:carbon-nitrogen hydrolase family protein [Rhizobium sp. 18055]|uniref:carbon-nitrogen hydrolase family protein n=1 Tax=Rhizobium sp. 18055 TaxID=2681403 RepID=UPI0013584122|nr:carbon-nitrogen hydrolase family protein [Rhizobium sp. 18055]
MRIATFQRFPVFDDAKTAAGRILRDLSWADDNNVDLAIFPECYLQGHSYDRSINERRALAIDDPVLLELLDPLSALKTAAIIGFIERRDAFVYNSAMLVEGGAVSGVYAKANPLEEGCKPGEDFPVWQRAGRTFGINICSDFRKPRLARKLVTRGASVICALLNMMIRADKVDHWREPAIESLRSCAIANGCWVVSSDVVGDKGDGWMSCGCTLAVRPDGTVVEKVAEWDEGAILLDID